jgi:hypothetical protein
MQFGAWRVFESLTSHAEHFDLQALHFQKLNICLRFPDERLNSRRVLIECFDVSFNVGA